MVGFGSRDSGCVFALIVAEGPGQDSFVPESGGKFAHGPRFLDHHLAAIFAILSLISCVALSTPRMMSR